MESKAPQSVVQDLPFLEAESPATTGIEAPVVAQHLIAVMKYLIQLLYIYVDDSFSAQKRGERLFYKPYHKYLPSNLTRLPQLWDFIGLPHEERKQVFGDVLPIIESHEGSHDRRV